MNLKIRWGLFSALLFFAARIEAATFEGVILDDDTSQPVAARIYISQGTNWFFPKSLGGSAIPFSKQAGPNSLEKHTTLSAHPFQIDLPPGSYRIQIERGKEYLPFQELVEVGSSKQKFMFRIKRWIHMNERGWYSGDTHTHRTLEELPNLVMAEEVNVTYPMSYWTINAFESPLQSEKSVKQPLSPKPIEVAPRHLIYPLNTEYELFSVHKKPHTVGAILLLNQKQVIDRGAPPIREIAREAHREGALLAFDKHNWEWSLMLPPVARMDLFDLANNHLWRTEFAFKSWGIPAPAYMKIDTNTESGWVHYGFQTYYALLNTGMRIAPTGGTGAGFHPAPFGFGRVYVNVPGQFSYDKWVDGLKKGNSFVTTGPMLFATVNGQPGDTVFQASRNEPKKLKIKGSAIFDVPLSRIEIIVNGITHEVIGARNHRSPSGGFESEFATTLSLQESSWVAVRVIQERGGGSIRFAHSAPWYLEVPEKPLKPRPEEIHFLVDRMETEIKRNKGILPPEAVAEFQEAADFYRNALK